jgi:Kef-type K+ transport system membrane component KefB
MILVFLFVVSIPLLFLVAHAKEFYKTRNYWNLLTIAVFLSSVTINVYALLFGLVSDKDSLFVFWKFFELVGLGMIATALGCLIRHILRSLDKVGRLSEQPHSFWGK